MSSSPQGGMDQESTFHQASYEADPSSSDANPTGRLGVYIGESSRSLHERTQEHLNDARKLDSKSHIAKHWMEKHPTLMNVPPFEFKLVRAYKDCLTRQVGEAVAIMLSEDQLLNGKSEYLTNCITRVRVEEDQFEKKRREMKEQEEEKENARRLEEFRNEKLPSIKGLKRKRNEHPIESHKYKKQNKKLGEYIAIKFPTTLTPCGSSQLKHCQALAFSEVLAIEYTVVKAIEYEDKALIITMHVENTHPEDKLTQYILKLTCWSAWWTRVVRQEGDRDPHAKYPRVKTCREAQKPGYIMKLAGWSAWWARVLRQESRVGKTTEEVNKVDKLEAIRKKNKIEKKIFVNKYFGDIKTPILTPRPDVTKCSESKRNSSSNSRGGSYPKRKQNFDNIFECGEQQNTEKIRRKK